jgi:hypothetical protein
MECNYIPTLCYRWSYMEVRNHFYTLAALTPRKELRYAMDRRMDWPGEQFWTLC